MKVDNAHLTVEHQHVDQETLHRQYDLAVAGQGLLASGKLNSDGYTPENERMSPKKRDWFNRKYTSEPTIDFQGTCVSFCGVFPLLLFLMDHVSLKKIHPSLLRCMNLESLAYIYLSNHFFRTNVSTSPRWRGEASIF